MDRKSLEIADEITGAIEQTDAWFEAYSADPSIQKSSEAFHFLIDHLPDGAGVQIGEAYNRLEADVTLAAILYGMRVMRALYEVIQSPEQLSQHILDRMRR